MVQNETSVVPARRPSNVVSRVLRKWNLSAGTYVLLTLWLFGLFCVFLFPPPMTITPQMQFLYEKEMEEALTLENQLIVDMRLYQIAKFRTDHAKIWFWRFQKEARSKFHSFGTSFSFFLREEVRKMQLLEKEAWRNVERSKRNYEAALAEANSQLGIWTSFGIERTRHLFWQAYQKGKIFAQQHTLFDIIYNLPNSRDADAIGQCVLKLTLFHKTNVLGSYIFLPLPSPTSQLR